MPRSIRRLHTIRVKLKESRTIAADIEKFKLEKGELEKKLAHSLKKLPNKKEIPDLIHNISDVAKEVGLKIYPLPARYPEKPQGFYAEVPIRMNVRGGYMSLYEFCDKISKLPRIVNISGLKVNVLKQGPSPELESNFTVTTFRFTPEGTAPSDKRKNRRGRKR